MNRFRIFFAKPEAAPLLLSLIPEYPYIWVGFFGKFGEVYYRSDWKIDAELSNEDLIVLIEMNLNNLISGGLIEVNITKKGLEAIKRNGEINEEFEEKERKELMDLAFDREYMPTEEDEE